MNDDDESAVKVSRPIQCILEGFAEDYCIRTGTGRSAPLVEALVKSYRMGVVHEREQAIGPHRPTVPRAIYAEVCAELRDMARERDKLREELEELKKER